MRRLAIAVCLVLLVAGAIRAFLPSVEAKRDVVVSSPSVSGIFVRSAVTLPRGDRACLSPVPLDPEMTSAQLLVNTAEAPAVPLEVSVRAPGYVARGRIPATYSPATDASVRVGLDAPQRPVDGRLCIRNLGRHPVLLIGTNEPRSLAQPAITLEGQPQPPQNIELTFYGDTAESVLDDPGSVVSRASAFTAAYVPEWLVWVLVVALLAGVPAGVVVALAWTLRSDEAGS